MENLKELIKRVSTAGWFSGKLILDIRIENQFEGFSGRASETWESRVTIDITSKDDCPIPSCSVVGGVYDNADTVAKKVLEIINNK